MKTRLLGRVCKTPAGMEKIMRDSTEMKMHFTVMLLLLHLQRHKKNESVGNFIGIPFPSISASIFGNCQRYVFIVVI